MSVDQGLRICQVAPRHGGLSFVICSEIVDPDTGNIINPDDPDLEKDNEDSEGSEIIEYDVHPCCNPFHALHRFFAFIFMCLLGFGSYFCYDNPGALQDNFMKDMNLKTMNIMFLYFIYAWPIVLIFPLVKKSIIHRLIGVHLCTVTCATLILIGQIIFALGGVLNMFWLMYVGRSVCGIGGQYLAFALNSYFALWFQKKELYMVFGLQRSFARVGSAVNFVVMEHIYNWVGKTYHAYMCTGVVLFIAASTCVISLVCGIILGFMGKRAERISKRKTDDDGDGGLYNISDVKDFPGIFWMVSIVCVYYYVAIFPFIALGKVFFERKFEFSPEDANTVNSIVYIISAVASPILVFLVNKVGKNVFWVFLSILVSIGCHALLAFTFVNPYVAMCALGIALSMLESALWPMVAIVTPEHQFGTAYGTVHVLQSFGFCIFSLVCGGIVESGGYLLLEVFFLFCLFVALTISVLIWILDSNSSGVLNMTPFQRDMFEFNRLVEAKLPIERMRDALLTSGSMSDIS